MTNLLSYQVTELEKQVITTCKRHDCKFLCGPENHFHGCSASTEQLVSYYLPWTPEASRTGHLERVQGIKEVLDLAHSALKDTLSHTTHVLAKNHDTARANKSQSACLKIIIYVH